VVFILVCQTIFGDTFFITSYFELKLTWYVSAFFCRSTQKRNFSRIRQKMRNFPIDLHCKKMLTVVTSCLCLVCGGIRLNCKTCKLNILQYWSLLNWRKMRFRCGCVAVAVNWLFAFISSFFAMYKNNVHRLEPGETPSYSASHQAPNYVKHC